MSEKEDKIKTRDDDALFALLQESLRGRAASPEPLSRTLPTLSEEDIKERENLLKKEFEETRNKWRAWAATAKRREPDKGNEGK